MVPHDLVVLIDDPRLAAGQSDVRMPVEAVDQRLEEGRVGVVVGLGEPDVIAPGVTQPQIPLPEGAPVIPPVEDGPHAGRR